MGLKYGYSRKRSGGKTTYTNRSGKSVSKSKAVASGGRKITKKKSSGSSSRSSGGSSSSSSKAPELMQNATIGGKVYDNVTEAEVLANKLSSNSKAVLDAERTSSRDKAVAKDNTNKQVIALKSTTAEKIKAGQELTADEQFFLLTGKPVASVESVNEFLTTNASSKSNIKASRSNIDNIYKYQEEAKEYQASKNKPTQATYTPPAASPVPSSSAWTGVLSDYAKSKQGSGLTKAVDYNANTRSVERWVTGIEKRQKEVVELRSLTRSNFGLEGLDPKSNDGPVKATFKGLGNVASAFTFELFSGAVVASPTVQNLFLTVEKAALTGYAGVSSIFNKQLRPSFLDTTKDQAKGALNAITPIDTTSLIEGEGLKYDPQGTTNIIAASALANVKAANQLKNPTPKTTGKVTSKNVEVKGTVKTSGTTTGQLTSDLPSQTSTVLKFTEQRAGLFNKIFKRDIATTIEQTNTGTLIKTQTLGPKSFVRTYQLKGSANAIVEKVVNNKLVNTQTIKGTSLASEFVKYEPIVEASSRSQIQITPNTVLQKGNALTIQNVKGSVSKNQQVSGPISITTKAEALSQAKSGSVVIGDTGAKGFNLRSLEVTEGKLATGTKAAANIKLTSSNLRNSATLTSKPPVSSVFQYTTEFGGKLKVENAPSITRTFLSSKRGSFGQDTSLVTRNPSVINELEIPNSAVTFKLPTLSTTSKGSFVAPIDLNSLRSTAAGQTTKQAPQRIIRPTTQTVPTLRLRSLTETTKINELETGQTTRPILDVKTRTKQGQSQINKLEPVQEVITKKINKLAPSQITKPTPIGFSRNVQSLDVPFLPKIPIIAGFNPPTNRSQGFNVFSRKGGKEFKLTSNPLSKSEALAFGSSVVGGSARASFRLQKASGSLGSFSGGSLIGDFNKNTKGWFVEKNSKRINTAGELSEITFSPLNTKEKKRGKKRKSKSKSPFAIKGGFF